MILASSISRRGEFSRLAELGFAAQLIKPIKQDDLFLCLAQLFAQHELQLEDHINHQELYQNALNLKVLIAEDNQINQQVAKAMLIKLGCEVDCVTNGLEALLAVKAYGYDAVLMDCQMPEMDGYQAASKIRELPRFKSLPIIALTANALKGDRERCLAAGMSDYLVKPIKPKALAVICSAGVSLNLARRNFKCVGELSPYTACL